MQKKPKDCTKEEIIGKLNNARGTASHYRNKCTRLEASLLLIKSQLNRISEHITVTKHKNVTYHTGKIQ